MSCYEYSTNSQNRTHQLASRREWQARQYARYILRKIFLDQELIHCTDNIIRLRRKKEELISKKTTLCYQITVTKSRLVEKAGLSTTIDKILQDLVRVRNERDLLKEKLEEAQIPSGPRAESDEEGPTKKRSREN